MSKVRFTKEHEYIRVDGDQATIGITDYAQSQLGDVVFVELPELGRVLSKGAEAAVVESVKAASEIYAPAAGEVVEVNKTLENEPSRVNEDPFGTGWFIKVKLTDPAEVDGLMDEAAYQEFVKTLE
jgi:glycine cleavage system H protein